MLDRALAAMLAVPAIERIVVVLERTRTRSGRRPTWGRSRRSSARTGTRIAASLRAGLEPLADAAAVVVTLGDQPFITPQVIAAILARADGPARRRATYRGRPGHPVLIKRQLFGEVRSLRGDAGARATSSPRPGSSSWSVGTSAGSGHRHAR